jgi:small subunit ribosomal protein S13
LKDKNKSEESNQDEFKIKSTAEKKNVSKDNAKELSEKTSIKSPEDSKKKKGESKKESKEDFKKKIDRGPDFRYIVRISNTDVNGEKNVVYGLSSIKGLGVHMATLIADQAQVDKKVLIGDLTDSQIQKIQEIINNANKTAPTWMLNHRKDYETGQNLHFVSTEIDIRLRDEINIMKKIRSYRGVRHELGLSVRGQRTGSNGRKGLALGVSKKKVEPQQS